MSDKGLLIARFLIRVAIGVVIVVEVVLALGVVLQAMGANPDAGFTEWTYRNQDRLMGPFEGMFDDSELGDGDGVLDVSGVFAFCVFVCLFIPLGMALGSVARARIRNDQRAHQAAEAARQARMFGGEPEPFAAQQPSVGQRLVGLFGRDRGTSTSQAPVASTAEAPTDSPETADDA